MILHKEIIYKVNSNVEMYAMENGTVLFDIESERISVINDIAAMIWEFIIEEEQYTFDDILKKINEEYCFEENNDVSHDIEEFISELLKNQLLQKKEA